MTMSRLLDAPQPSPKTLIKEWDISSIPDSVIILLVGKRGSGKTTLLMDLLYHLRDRFDAGIAVAPTMTTTKLFRRCMCDSLIYEDMESADQVISMLTDVQGMFAEGEDGGRARKLYFVADDCMFDKKAFRTETIKKILFNGRHYSITFINTVQYLMTADTTLRSQVDYLLVVGEPTPETREKMWEIFFKCVFDPTADGKKLFYLTLKKLTTDHKCLVLDNKTTKKGIAEKIFWYKAIPTEELPPFHMNKAVYRKMHQQTYIPLQVRLDKKKQEFLAHTMRRISGQEDVIELQKASTRGRGRGRGRAAAGGTARRAPSARPKLPARRSRSPSRHSTRTSRTSRTDRRPYPSRSRSRHASSRLPEDDIQTNVTYGSSQSTHSMSTFVPPTRCKGGLCGPAPDTRRLR